MKKVISQNEVQVRNGVRQLVMSESYTYVQTMQLRLSSEGRIMGVVTGAGTLLATTGLIAGGLLGGGAAGGAFFWAKHSSSIVLSCSVESLFVECNSRMALANEASKDMIM